MSSLLQRVPAGIYLQILSVLMDAPHHAVFEYQGRVTSLEIMFDDIVIVKDLINGSLF
jgi:hypothetical protein